MKACKAKTKDGTRCAALAGEDGYCMFHSPAQVEARAAGRKAGGYRRRVPHVADLASVPAKIRSVSDVMLLLDAATQDALVLENSTVRTRALVGLAACYLKALEVGELEGRLALIERILKGVRDEQKQSQ